MRRYKVDMIPGGVSDVVHVSSGDNGYTVQILLVKGSSDYSIPPGTSVRLEWSGGSYSCTYSENSVQMPIMADMTAESGRKPVEIVLYQGDQRIGTANLILCVEVAT